LENVEEELQSYRLSEEIKYATILKAFLPVKFSIILKEELPDIKSFNAVWCWWYYPTLLRDGGVEELHGDLTVGPRPKV